MREHSQTNTDTHSKTTFTDGSTTNVQTRWSVAEASELVSDFIYPNPADKDGHGLTPDQITPEHTAAWQRHRTVVDEKDGKRLAVLISPERYDELTAVEYAVNDMAEKARTDGAPTEKYMPYVHSPNANPDRLIDFEHLERALAKLVHGAKLKDLDREHRDTIHYQALALTVTMELDPDERGIIPIMTLARISESHLDRYLWEFVIRSDVPGLYLREEAGFFGHTYAVLSASGHTLRRGFWSTEAANAYVTGLTEALPGIDWFIFDQNAVTDAIRETVADVNRRFTAHGPAKTEEAAA